MGETFVPLADLRYAAALPRIPEHAAPPTGLLADRLGRPLRDLRISVTDRCNFRCSYCMPKEVFDKAYKLPAAQLAAQLRGDHAHGAAVRRPRRGQAAADRRRAAAAQAPRSADRAVGRAAHGAGRAAGHHAHHQRLAARTQGRGAARGRSAARDGEPGRAGRHHLQAHERRRLPGRRRAARHRRRAAQRGWRRSRSTWSSSAAPTTTRSCRWRATCATPTARA